MNIVVLTSISFVKNKKLNTVIFPDLVSFKYKFENMCTA